MNKPQSPLILVADDDPAFLQIIGHHLRSWSYRVECATDKGRVFHWLATIQPDLLLMDVRFGDHDGLEVLRQVLGEYPQLKVLMLTAFGSIDNAISAMRFGAVDYLTKPVDLQRLRSMIDSIDRSRTAASDSVASPGSGATSALPSRPILGESRPIRELRARIDRVAASDSTVLVLGESGTGKELVARAIHELSPRRQGPFVPLNVAALPRELVESTLFGHTKGAFTGADRMQAGCCEIADSGTFFLDEIGEMEIGLQAKLLRFLQERTFQKVGESQPIAVDVRIVAATNRDPLEQIRRGLMRQDLYYRLNVVPIVVPPLRERLDDIPLLAQNVLDRCATRCGRPAPGFSELALTELRNYEWPGNVRELENVVERLALLCPSPIFGAEDVRAELGDEGTRQIPGFEPVRLLTEVNESESVVPPHHLLRPMERMEYEALAEALQNANGNVREAARRLGLGQATVYRKIKKYRLTS